MFENAITYQLSRQAAGEYQHLTAHVHIHDNDGYERCEFEFTWIAQSKPGNDNFGFNEDGSRRWFGFNVECRMGDYNRIAMMQKTIKKIFNGIVTKYSDYGYDFAPTLEYMEPDPRVVIQRLEAMRNCHRVVYDGRVSDKVKIENVAPANFSRYMDDYNHPGTSWSSCQVACLARNDQEAQALLLSEFANDIQKAYNSNKASIAGKLQEWIAAGQPVKMNRNRIPNVQTVKELLT